MLKSTKTVLPINEWYLIISNQNTSYCRLPDWLNDPDTQTYLIKGNDISSTIYAGKTSTQFFISNGKEHFPLIQTDHPYFYCTLGQFLDRGKNVSIEELNHLEFYRLEVTDPTVLEKPVDPEVLRQYGVMTMKHIPRKEIQLIYNQSGYEISSQSKEGLAKLGLYQYILKYWNTDQTEEKKKKPRYLVLFKDSNLIGLIRQHRYTKVNILHCYDKKFDYFIDIPKEGFRGKKISADTLVVDDTGILLENLEDLVLEDLSVSDLNTIMVYEVVQTNLDPMYSVPVNIDDLIKPSHLGKFEVLSISTKDLPKYAGNPYTDGYPYAKMLYHNLTEICNDLKAKNQLAAIGRLYCICENEINDAVHPFNVEDIPQVGLDYYFSGGE